jgi:hypothetical protein
MITTKNQTLNLTGEAKENNMKKNWKTGNPIIKTIKLGAIHIASFDPADGKMFSYDYYYDKNDDFYDDSCDKEVKACDPNEVVLCPHTPYELIIDYPTSYPYRNRFNTGKYGMTRIQLAAFICKHYCKMYADEDVDEAIGKEGRYGIYGHYIGDLVLCSATVDGKNFITLGVDS